MPRHRRIELACLLSLIASVAASGMAVANDPRPEAPRVTLADLTNTAISHYPAIREKRLARDVADARAGEARVSPFFQWQGTAGFTATPDASGTPIYSSDSELPLGNGWGPAAQVGIEGVIPLYTFGKIRAAREATRAGVDAAEHDVDRTLAKVRFDVRRAYFGLQFSLDVRQMISEGQGALRQAVETLERRIEEGTGDVDEMDRYRLAAAVAELDARDSEARRLSEGTESALRTLSGITEFRVPECPMTRVEFQPAPLREYVDGADRPEFEMLEALARARAADLTIQRAGFAPDLGLGFSARYSWAPGITDQNNPFIQDDGNRSQLGAALVMRWSLDFLGNRYRVRRAEAERARADAQAEEARAGIDLEIETTYQQVEDADRRELAWREGHRQTRRWFIASLHGYQVGTTDAETLLDAIRTYFQNRSSHLQSIFDYNVAVASLERVTGNVLRPDDGWEPPCEE